MKNQQLWYSAAKQGAILGGLLALSTLFESYTTLSGKMGLMTLMLLEWIVVVILHYYLLHRATKQYRNRFTAEEGFTFGQGYGYLMIVSAFAGVIVGVVQAIYLHLILGYAHYVDLMISSMQKMLAMGGQASASMHPILAQSFEQLQNQPIPSVLSTVWGGVLNTLLFAVLFGLIIAGVLAKAPKLFDKTSDEE